MYNLTSIYSAKASNYLFFNYDTTKKKNYYYYCTVRIFNTFSKNNFKVSSLK